MLRDGATPVPQVTIFININRLTQYDAGDRHKAVKPSDRFACAYIDLGADTEVVEQYGAITESAANTPRVRITSQFAQARPV